MLPRNRAFTRVRWDLADRDLWHPLVVSLIVGACSHPAQAAWTTGELEDAIAARIKYHCIDIHLRLLEQDRAAQKKAADAKRAERSAPRRRRRV